MQNKKEREERESTRQYVIVTKNEDACKGKEYTLNLGSSSNMG